MKKFAFYLLLNVLFFGLMASSCEQTPVPVEDPTEDEDKKPDDKEGEKEEGKDDGKTEEPIGPQPGTYQLVASPLKGVWEVGDQVYVHGNIGTEAEVITLAADNILEGGKKAQVALSTATNSPSEPDALYAAWPAEAVYQYKGVLKNKTTFEDCDRLLTVAYLEGDTFNFTDVSSTLSFTVSGDYNQYALVANNFAGLNYTRLVVEQSTGQNKFSTKNNGEPFRKGALESGKTVHLWFPGKVSIKGGITLYVGKDGDYPLAYRLDEKLSLAAGEDKDLGDITASLEPHNDPGPNPPTMGKRTKFKVKFNELSGLCLSADGDFLWSVGDNGELAQFDFEGNLLNRVVLKWGDAKDHPKKKEGETWGGYDTEGITVNLLNNDIWVSMEQNYIGIIPFEDQATIFAADTAWSVLNTVFRIPDAADYGNSGTEGITYYKDGKAYIGAQDGPAHLFLYDLDTHEELLNVRLGDKFPSMSEIAGLSYDPYTDWLWVIDSNSPQKMFALSGDASRVLAVYILEDTDNPESICVDHMRSCIWVGDDAGSTSYIYRYDFEGLDNFNIAP